MIEIASLSSAVGTLWFILLEAVVCFIAGGVILPRLIPKLFKK